MSFTQRLPQEFSLSQSITDLFQGGFLCINLTKEDLVSQNTTHKPLGVTGRHSIRRFSQSATEVKGVVVRKGRFGASAVTLKGALHVWIRREGCLTI